MIMDIKRRNAAIGVYVLGFLCMNVVLGCGTGCKTCYSGNTCTNCDNKYYLSAGICFACRSSCTSCTDYNDCDTDTVTERVVVIDYSNNVIYAAVVGALGGISVTLLVVAIAAIYYFRKRRKHQAGTDRNPETPGIPISDFTSTSTEHVSEYEKVDGDRQTINHRDIHQQGRLNDQVDNDAADYSSASKYEDLVDQEITENQYNVIVQHPYENM